MNNTIKFPPRLMEMPVIALRDATSIDTDNDLTCCQVCGSDRTITSFADYSGTVAGTVKARVVSHTFLTGDSVVISDTTNYNGTFTVTRIDNIYFYFTETYAGSETGIATETDDEIEYSPLDGLPAVKVVIRSGGNSVQTFIFDSAQTLYPNLGFAIKTVGYVDADGSLNTSVASAQKAPHLLVSEETSASTARDSDKCYAGPTGYPTGYSDKWRTIMLPRRNYVGTASETLKAWCSTIANRGFTTTAISFERVSGSTEKEVYYLGGVSTELIDKAKIVISWQNMQAGSYATAVPAMKAHGWKGVAFVQGELHSVSPYIERLTALYAAGWDISNHSWEHITLGSWATEQDVIYDMCKQRRWAMDCGFIRGINFVAYPGTVCRLEDDNGADVLDPFFTMGRGRGYRKDFYNGSYGSNDGYTPIVPNDNMNISHVAATAGSNTDYDSSDAKVDLAETVLDQGVLHVYFHDINESPNAIQTHTNWWTAFVVDLAAREAAGEIEVITMTDWWNDIQGLPRGGGGRQMRGRYHNV